MDLGRSILILTGKDGPQPNAAVRRGAEANDQ